jgi:hypothetical protein
MAAAAQRKGEAEAEASGGSSRPRTGRDEVPAADVAMRRSTCCRGDGGADAPAKAISEIKVLQLQGAAMGASNGDGRESGSRAVRRRRRRS